MPSSKVCTKRRAQLAGFGRQVLFSIPHYLREIAELETLSDWRAWCYYKWPHAFPLAAFPPYVTVEVTNACNLACRHCWRSAMRRPIGYIELQLFEKIVGQLRSHLPITFKVGGTGEVALHPGLQDLMETLNSRRGVKVVLYTNGALLRRLCHRRILEWNLHTLIISVDGTDLESYNSIRVGGDYRLLRSTVEEFCSLRNRLGRTLPQIEIRHVIMPHETWQQLVDFRKSWLTTSDTVKFNHSIPLDSYIVPAIRSQANMSPLLPCRHINREFCVEWDGRVRLCGKYPKYLGDLHNSTIEELWHSPEANAVRDCHRHHDFDQIPVCRGCL